MTQLIKVLGCHRDKPVLCEDPSIVKIKFMEVEEGTTKEDSLKVLLHHGFLKGIDEVIWEKEGKEWNQQ